MTDFSTGLTLSTTQKYLVETVMDNGGRFAMYDIMGMDRPAIKPEPVIQAVELKIDREGTEDPARYKGLKMTTMMDDDAMGAALEEANRKAKAGERLRPKLMEEDYVQPFAGQ